jgi:hypothetical protein
MQQSVITRKRFCLYRRAFPIHNDPINIRPQNSRFTNHILDIYIIFFPKRSLPGHPRISSDHTCIDIALGIFYHKESVRQDRQC